MSDRDVADWTPVWDRTRPVGGPDAPLDRTRPWWSALTLLVISAAVGVVVAVLAASAAHLTAAAVTGPVEAWQDLPDLPAQLDPPAERSDAYAADGTLLATFTGDEDRIVVDLADVPPVLVDAVLSAEDDDFYRHAGVDARAVVRAGLAGLGSGRFAQGGSTITQQLVKLLTGNDDHTIARKLTEVHQALQLEDRLTKDEILQLYLNEVYLGQRVYGVATAARYYFSVDVADLTLPQAATLAGILTSPSTANPVDGPDLARRRRDLVLARMHHDGRISAAQLAAASAGPVQLSLSPLPAPAEPFYTDVVRAELLTLPELGATVADRQAAVHAGGLQIHTTLQPAMQQAATDVIAATIPAAAGQPQVTVATVEPGTGRVLAVAVGPHPYGTCVADQPDCTATTVNPAVAGLGGSGRSLGSAIKPFVAAAMLHHGIASTVALPGRSGTPIVGCPDATGLWAPSNYAGGGPAALTLPDAMRTSNNTFFASAVGRLGPHAVTDVAEAMGLAGPDRLADVCPVALGAVEVFGVDVAAAIGTLAADGTACRPFVVARVEAADGTVLVDRDQAGCHQVIDAGVAARVTSTMVPVAQSGTGRAAALPDRPVAVKTGTAQAYSDAWLVGFTPPTGPAGAGSLATAVWMGHTIPAPLVGIGGVSRVTGGSLPARIWHDYMAEVTAGSPAGAFPAPPGEQVTVPDVTGQQAATATGLLAAVPLRVAVEQVAGTEPAGTVLGTLPPAGRTVTYLSAVTVQVSTGQEPLPVVVDVVGMTARQAIAALAPRPVAVHVLPELGDGRAVGQWPPPGIPWVATDQVQLWVTATQAPPPPAPPPAAPPPRPAPPAAVPAPLPTTQPEPSGPIGRPGPAGAAPSPTGQSQPQPTDGPTDDPQEIPLPDPTDPTGQPTGGQTGGSGDG